MGAPVGDLDPAVTFLAPNLVVAVVLRLMRDRLLVAVVGFRLKDRLLVAVVGLRLLAVTKRFK